MKFKLLENWKARRRAERHAAGYGWAAGLLLSKRCTTDDIEGMARSVFNDYFDCFDDGAMQAARDYEGLTRSKA